jgi:FKBP-type peptidyl-prolyl cis-trans isomerase FklB
MAVFGMLIVACPLHAGEQISLQNQKEKMSYIIGLDIGTNLKKQSLDLDPDILYKGMKDALSGAKPLMSDEEMQKTKNEFRQAMMKKQEEEMRQIGEKNKREGEAFLAENGKKEGVKTLPSGLQYRILTEGTGKTPKATDTVTVNYRGTFLDGKEFDSSYSRGKPADLAVNQIIPGWSEALQLMKVGSKWQLVIPANLAYGERGAGNVIGPHATLIFEIELISIQ